MEPKTTPPAPTLASPYVAELLKLIDSYKRAMFVCIPDTTVSHRVFDDCKKLAGLRSGADISTRRLVVATQRIKDIWPPHAEQPHADVDSLLATQTSKD